MIGAVSSTEEYEKLERVHEYMALRIDGKQISTEIKDELKEQVQAKDAKLQEVGNINYSK